jgi:hypothetical protein
MVGTRQIMDLISPFLTMSDLFPSLRYPSYDSIFKIDNPCHQRTTEGTMAQVKAMVAILNSCGEIPLASEVVIAVPSLHLLSTKSIIRGDIAIAAEVKNTLSIPEKYVIQPLPLLE